MAEPISFPFWVHLLHLEWLYKSTSLAQTVREERVLLTTMASNLVVYYFSSRHVRYLFPISARLESKIKSYCDLTWFPMIKMLETVFILFIRIFSISCWWSYKKNFGTRQKCVDLNIIIARLCWKLVHHISVQGQRSYAKIIIRMRHNASFVPLGSRQFVILFMYS